MKESDKEKYLGDFLIIKANLKDTIQSRKSKGYAISSEISAMLKYVPMESRRTQIGLELRKSWFQNGCLLKSQVWSGLSENNLKDWEVIDRKILRVIIGAQAKVPIEMLYLETAQLPNNHVISVRRLLYGHTLLKQNKEELTSKIYFALKIEPLKGDLIWLDLEKIGFSISDEEMLSNLTNDAFKRIIKKKVRQLSVSEIENMKDIHKKVKLINHNHTNLPQEYLTNGKFSNSKKSLHGLHGH